MGRRRGKLCEDAKNNVFATFRDYWNQVYMVKHILLAK